MISFEQRLASELAGLLRAGATVRAVRITVYEEVITCLSGEPLGPAEVSETVSTCLRVAHRIVREHGAPGDLVQAVLESALDAVRGHGGETSRWFAEAVRTASRLLEEFERGGEGGLGWRRDRPGRLGA